MKNIAKFTRHGNLKEQRDWQGSMRISADDIIKARKMWASSECVNPYSTEYACENLMSFIQKEGTHG